MPRANAKTTAEMPGDPLDHMLARLKLSGIRDQLDSLLDEAARSNLSTRERGGELDLRLRRTAYLSIGSR